MNFFEGLAQGIAPGLQAWGQRGADERVARAWLNAHSGDPAGKPDPLASLAALKGGGAPPPPAPAPQAGPPAAPFKPGAPLQPGRPDPLAPLPQGGPPAPPPGAPTGQPGAEAPTGMSVAPGVADPVKEGQSIIQNLVQTTKTRNPKADPLTIMQAVEKQIDDIKGVAPMTKAVMQGQLQYLNFTMKGQQFQEREDRLRTEHMQKLIELSQHHANQDAVAAENARFRGEMVNIARDRASYYGESVEYQHEDRESAEAGRNARGLANLDSRMSIAQLKEAGLDDRSAAAIKGKNGAAIVSALSRVKASGMGGDDQKTLDILIAAMGQGGGGGSSPAPAPKRAGGGGSPSVPAGARKAPDGHWYVKKGGSYYRVQ